MDRAKNRQEKQRTKACIVEMYHAQISAAQADLVAIQQEINELTEVVKRKREIEGLLIDAKAGLLELSAAKEYSLRFELEGLSAINFNMKSNLIEMKSRIRERMFKIMSELAKIQGVFETPGTWQQAVSTLLDNGLLPVTIAETILQTIQQVEINMAELNKK